MKTLLKYGVIGSLLLLASTYATVTPYLKDYFDSSVSGAAKFVILGGVNLYGINAFLKSKKQRNTIME